jgi:hypothetical protein
MTFLHVAKLALIGSLFVGLAVGAAKLGSMLSSLVLP